MRLDPFVRVLATLYPQNKYAEPNFTVPEYSLVNLYLGVRNHDGAWEASIFAKNLLNAQVATDILPQQLNLNTPLTQFFGPNSVFHEPNLLHSSGYYETLMTPQREVGINVRYAFGSR